MRFAPDCTVVPGYISFYFLSLPFSWPALVVLTPSILFFVSFIPIFVYMPFFFFIHAHTLPIHNLDFPFRCTTHTFPCNNDDERTKRTGEDPREGPAAIVACLYRFASLCLFCMHVRFVFLFHMSPHTSMRGETQITQKWCFTRRGTAVPGRPCCQRAAQLKRDRT
ncbi:hypothetical protein EI94DRAFT_643020 [Lactarius quietus]|nr:hypothetical protein EI94DRAFT_643020 [Lactarius quietus]